MSSAINRINIKNNNKERFFKITNQPQLLPNQKGPKLIYKLIIKKRNLIKPFKKPLTTNRK